MFFVGLSPFYSRQKLERELLTWSFQNARGTVSLNLFKYQTLLFTSRANAKNIFDLAGIMSFSFVQDFIFNFYIFLWWGGGLFSSCQHLRIAIALFTVYVQVMIFIICVQLIYFALAADQQFLNRFCIYHTYWI